MTDRSGDVESASRWRDAENKLEALRSGAFLRRQAPWGPGGAAECLETFVSDTSEIRLGGRVRMRPKLLGVRQDALADALGLAFQPVQKYERGANRISASKPYEIAKALEVPVSFVFDGLADPVTGEPDEVGVACGGVIAEFLNTPEGLEPAELFPKTSQDPVGRQVLGLVRAMAEDESRKKA